jgi:hypothetical protein
METFEEYVAFLAYKKEANKDVLSLMHKEYAKVKAYVKRTRVLEIHNEDELETICRENAQVSRYLKKVSIDIKQKIDINDLPF